MAELKFFDNEQFENPELHVVQVHLGVEMTDMHQRGRDAGIDFPLDDGKITPLSAKNQMHQYKLMT